jgi:hypothetical protein
MKGTLSEVNYQPHRRPSIRNSVINGSAVSPSAASPPTAMEVSASIAWRQPPAAAKQGMIVGDHCSGWSHLNDL